MRQPLWDKYETALLIEAYWKIREDSSMRGRIISDLSSCLRKRADFDIDSTYRNENGIRMRLGELDCLFNPQKRGLKNTSELFRKMTQMYVENRIQFDKILLEAKSVDSDKIDSHDGFVQWLQKNAPKGDVNRICKLLQIGEEFCLKLKVLDRPLFETKDVKIIRKFVRTVSENKVFQFQNKKTHPGIVRAANWYASFVWAETDPDKTNGTTIEVTKDDRRRISLTDTVLDYFSEMQDQFPDFVFTNANANGETEKRAVYIYPMNMDRRGNVLFEIWQTSTEGLFDLYIKRSLLSEEEYNESLASWSKTTETRGRITREWRFSADVMEFVLPKLLKAVDILSSREEKTVADPGVFVPADEVKSILVESTYGVSKQELCSRLAKYSTYQINLALEKNHSVLVLKRYYDKDSISDYQEMADTLLEVIKKQFVINGGYTSAKQLYNEARPRLDDFFFYNNAFDSRQEVYDLAVHLFKQEKHKGYSLVFANSMHIWEKEPNYPKDYCGLLIKYAREHSNVFSREEAMTYLEWIGSTSPSATFSNLIYTTGSTVFLQYAENQFVLSEALNIGDVFLSILEAQIENLLGVDGDDYVAMGEIDDFFYSTLPQLPNGVYWTPLLIEDILRTHDIGFTTIEAGKDNDKKTYPAAIVRKKTQYRNFADVVWSEVSKEYSLPKEFTSVEFRDFLLDKGLIRGAEKMWSVHKTVEGDLRFYWTDNNGRVTIN